MNPFMKKLPKGAEACLIMVCTTEFAPFPMLIFTRLHRPQIFRSFCEVSSPTRFVCIIVGPIGSETRVVDMGKALGTLMSDQVRAFQHFTQFVLECGFLIDFPFGGLQSDFQKSTDKRD